MVLLKKKVKLYCVCRRPDDGSPMVQCDVCKEWFHCRCINITREQAEQMGHYHCPTCKRRKTGEKINNNTNTTNNNNNNNSITNQCAPLPPGSTTLTHSQPTTTQFQPILSHSQLIITPLQPTTSQFMLNPPPYQPPTSQTPVPEPPMKRRCVRSPGQSSTYDNNHTNPKRENFWAIVRRSRNQPSPIQPYTTLTPDLIDSQSLSAF